MWIVKLGGSLDRDPALPQWLELLTRLGGGRVTVVPGGGSFADEARRTQAHWGIGDVAAHNMAVLGMAQVGHLFAALEPQLQPAVAEADVRHVLRRGRTALWMPLSMLREASDENTSWDVTSDSLALQLALRLNAERLVVVKSCAVDASRTIDQLSADGVLDKRFPSLAARAAFPIDVIGKDDMASVRAWLLGEVRASA